MGEQIVSPGNQLDTLITWDGKDWARSHVVVVKMEMRRQNKRCLEDRIDRIVGKQMWGGMEYRMSSLCWLS